MPVVTRSKNANQSGQRDQQTQPRSAARGRGKSTRGALRGGRSAQTTQVRQPATSRRNRVSRAKRTRLAQGEGIPDHREVGEAGSENGQSQQGDRRDEEGSGRDRSDEARPAEIPIEEELEIGVVTHLMDIVEQYRHSKISKVDAIIAIGSTIPIADRNSDEFLLPYRTFVEQLEQIDVQRDNALHRAGQVDGRQLHGTNNEEGQLQFQSTKSRGDLIASISAIDPELANDPTMLWNSAAALDISNLTVSLQKSIRLLRIYRSNHKTFVQLAMSRGRTPQIPYAEWTKIVRGEPVDYEDIYKQLDSHFIIQQKQLDLGNSIILNISDESETIASKRNNKKEINSSTDWMRVHSLVSRATTILFKHREEELRKYGEHILSLFYNQSDAQLVVHYDRAVRNKYAQENAFDLSDTNAFFTT
jgi:hypothetical protein